MKNNKLNNLISQIFVVLFIIISGFPINNANAQSNFPFYNLSNNDTNIYQISNLFYQGFTGNPDTNEGAYYSEFSRFSDYWAPRLAPSGNFNVAFNAMSQYMI